LLLTDTLNLAYGTTSVGDWCPMSADSIVVQSSRVNCTMKAWTFDPWSWDPYAVSERQMFVVMWCAISQKKEELNWIAAKAKYLTLSFYLYVLPLCERWNFSLVETTRILLQW
jgi:hypothetical protein